MLRPIINFLHSGFSSLHSVRFSSEGIWISCVVGISKSQGPTKAGLLW